MVDNIDVMFTPTNLSEVDIFTKPIARTKFKYMTRQIELQTLH